jgi:hypothetical protein
MNDIRNADMIVVGNVTDYEVVTSSETPSWRHGLVTVRIANALKGDVSGEVKLLWQNSTFELPEELPATEPAIIAARRLNGDTPSPQGQWHVLQAPCSSPFILPYSRRAIEDIGLVLRGGSVARGEEEYWEPDQNALLESTPATHSRESSGTPLIVLAGALGLGAAATIWMLPRRRRKRPQVD